MLSTKSQRFPLQVESANCKITIEIFVENYVVNNVVTHGSFLKRFFGLKIFTPNE